MDINELTREYVLTLEGEGLSEGERVKRNIHFVKMLLSENSPEMISYHYDLLKKREYKELYYDLRAAFMDRPQVEDFLVNKLSTETEPVILGDILHLLGRMRSSHAAPLARQFVNNSDNYQREVALYVLGWVGNELDIAILNEHLLNEISSHLRITAASAHRQMYYRLPEFKNKLLASLKKGFEKEEDDGVIAWIIVMIESIAVKRLGLREDKEDPYIIHGDIQKAKVKTSMFINELN